MIKPCSYWIKDLEVVKWFKFEELATLQNYFKTEGFQVKKHIHDIREKKTITKGEKCYIDLLDSKSIQIVNAAKKDKKLNEIKKVVDLFQWLLPGLITNVAFMREQIK